MAKATHWAQTPPTEPGWYWWRYGTETEPELVHVWLTQRRGNNYGWGPKVLLAKRMHEVEPALADALCGLWQKANGEAVPVTPHSEPHPEEVPPAESEEAEAEAAAAEGKASGKKPRRTGGVQL